jgi:hypothetical protein
MPFDEMAFRAELGKGKGRHLRRKRWYGGRADDLSLSVFSPV